MEQKIIFRNRLEELVKQAQENGGIMERSQIDQALGESLTGEQLELVYQYLEEQKIQIEGWSQDVQQRLAGRKILHEGEISGEEMLSALECYIEELNALSEHSGKEKEELFARALAQDAAAMQSLAEVYLPMVCDLASEFEQTAGMPVEDLVQEGNIALWMALTSLEEAGSLAAMEAQLMNAVQSGMERAIQAELDENDQDQAMAKRVNRLHEAIRALEEELEHEASVDELSAYLEMPAQQIRDILKLAGDELKRE